MRTKEFFDKFSSFTNYIDPELVEKVYYGMLRFMSAELRKSGEIKIPGWGTFRIVEIDEKRIRNVETGETGVSKASQVIKFKPCDGLKYYIRNLNLENQAKLRSTIRRKQS